MALKDRCMISDVREQFGLKEDVRTKVDKVRKNDCTQGRPCLMCDLERTAYESGTALTRRLAAIGTGVSQNWT
ncbi:hypothetical protein EVAR_57114_1 [Eumeta japonica]|uniref:Uncharacterized protein n=1 Tax=Eumeta variegata TaxID=151549 RepID=A0A4C1YQ38_EUMVA|nr:hypothetical protein EVAR_57114_1 [Eumeta japonica]